jgi:hypothetical protein
MPWGKPLEHPVGPLRLLELPLAFTQNALLSPDDFVKRAGERGVNLRTEHLVELHRRRALVPLFRIVQRPPRLAVEVPVAAGAAGGYGQYRSAIALVVAAAAHGMLIDPGTAPYRRWDGGLPLPAHGGVRRYPSVFYSPYQLLALRPLQGLLREMSAGRAADGRIALNLAPLTEDEVAALDGCRRLAILLSGLDMHYLPRILLTAGHATAWEKEDPGFAVGPRLDMYATAPEDLAATAGTLLGQAGLFDPLGKSFDLIRQAHPKAWSGLRGDALVAMEYRIAAEVLLRALDDLGRTDLSMPPPRKGRMYATTLDDRLVAEPERLEDLLADHGLSPRPSVLLVLEGDTEMMLMPRVLAEIYGKPVPPTIIELADMKTIDRDLDLLVRHEAGPRLGDDHGDMILLARAPTRVLVAVDPEKRFASRTKQRAERDKLVRRLHESLPVGARSKQSLRQLEALVQVVTWGTTPWEFANFTDAELATAIERCAAVPPGTTRRDLVSELKTERAIGKGATARRSPNVEMICRTWPAKFRKVELAEELWPVLQAKVRRDIASGKRLRVPAARVAVKALGMAARAPRGRTALRVR